MRYRIGIFAIALVITTQTVSLSFAEQKTQLLSKKSDISLKKEVTHAIEKGLSFLFGGQMLVAVVFAQ